MRCGVMKSAKCVPAGREQGGSVLDCDAKRTVVARETLVPLAVRGTGGCEKWWGSAGGARRLLLTDVAEESGVGDFQL